MFCNQCGKENSNDAAFCNSCGARIGGTYESSKVEVSKHKMLFYTEHWLKIKRHLLWFIPVLIIVGILFIFFFKEDDFAQPNNLLKAYAQEWEERNFADMYDFLSKETRANYGRDTFVNRHKELYEELGIEQLQVSFNPLNEKEIEYAEKDRITKILAILSIELKSGEALNFEYEVSLVLDNLNKNEQWALEWMPDVSGSPFHLYDKMLNFVETIYGPVANTDSIEEGLFDETINILLINIDNLSGSRKRLDSYVLISFNPKNMSKKIVTIPRDTRVNIPGRGKDKINHSFAFGGTELTIDTVKQAFDLPIHFYLQVNLEGFQKSVFMVDGIKVNNKFAFSENDIEFLKGDLQLDSEKTFHYLSGEGGLQESVTFGERYSDVVRGLIDEVSNFSIIEEILDVWKSDFRTDLDLDILKMLLLNDSNTEFFNLKGSDETINGIYYYEVPEKEFDRIRYEMTDH